MPYIEERRAAQLDTGDQPRTPGELNYVLSREAARYLRRSPEHQRTYAKRAEVYGALQAAAAEFYRRALAPYESEKKADEQNRDPYERSL